MTSLASQQRPNLTVDVGLAQTSGKHPRQSSRAQVHAARSAQAPRSQPQPRPQQYHQHSADQGGFSSDGDVHHNSETYARGAVAGQYDDPLNSSDEDDRATARSQQPHYQQQLQQQQQQQRRLEENGAYGDEYQDDAGLHHLGDEGDNTVKQQGVSSLDHGEEEEEEYEDEDLEEDDDDEDDEDLSSSPSIPDENIDFDLVYAFHTFIATVEGQATVSKGNSLTLLDDSNSYWWLVRVLRTQEVGYIPAENIETPFERLARLNKHRNVDLTVATDDDVIQVPSRIYSSHLVKQRDATTETGLSEHSGKLSALSRRREGAPRASPSPQPNEKPSVVFGPPSYVEHSGDEYESEEEEVYDNEDGEYEEDEEEGDSRDMDEDELRAQMEQEHGYDAADFSEPGIRVREPEGISDESRPSIEQQSHATIASAIPSTAAGKRSMLEKMEPDDGMDWDAHEGDDGQVARVKEYRLQQQQQRDQAAAQMDVGVGKGRGTPHVDASAHPIHHHSRPSQEQNQPRYARDPTHHQQDPSTSYTSSEIPQTISDHSISSVMSSADGPIQSSQVQGGRDRAISNGSEYSHVSSTASTTSIRDKSGKRKSKGSSIDAGEETIFADEKSTKKRSGVFSGLFSRNKDKKDRKSGSFSSAGGSTLGGNDELIVVTRPSEESTRPREASSGQGPTGLARTLQERDRASQDAYSRQFLADRSSSFSETLSPRQGKQRPGSLIATPSSVPMLNVVRVFAGEGIHSDSTFKTVLLNESTSARDLVRQATQRFRLHEPGPGVDYYLTVKLLEGSERPLRAEEKPLQVFDRLCQLIPEEASSMPSIKRSSIGSISSISSNLSLNPAIARVNGDFSDDHSVKFFLTRVSRADPLDPLPGGPALKASSQNGNDGSRSSHIAGGLQQDITLSLSSSSTAMPHQLDSRSADSTLLQAPTAKFALRLLIFPSELPEGTVFDPQTTALVPTSVLAERGAGGSIPSEHVEQRFREKVIFLASNATVAEVIETGLDRFGIMEGVVEGGDDVEERASRRKTRGRIQYGLAVDASRGGPAHERSLAPNSKIIDAYKVPPIFQSSTANKRRSTDSAMLLNMAEEPIRVDDPVFILRIVTSYTHAHGKHAKTVRALSPTEDKLVSRQEQQRHADINSYKAGVESSRSTKDVASAATLHSVTSSPNAIPRSKQQEVIAAQRAAAKERKAAVLGAQRNEMQGIDLYLENKGKIRSSRSLEGTVRYSYLPDPMEASEVDISSIVEDVLADQDPARMADRSESRGGRPAGPTRDPSTATLNTFHSPPTTPTGLAAPMDPREAHIEWKSRGQAGLTAPLSLGGPRGARPAGQSQKDLLETFVRNPDAEEATIEDRIDSVLSRVARETAFVGEGRSSGRRTPTAATSTADDTVSGNDAFRLAGAPSEAGGSSGGGRTTADTYSGKSGLGSGLSHDGTMTTNPTPVSLVAAGAAARVVPTGAIATSNTANVSRGDTFSNRSASVPTAISTRANSSSSPGPAAYIPSDDFGLDHLYNIVDAAMRRDPKKYVQVPARSRSSTPGSMRLSGIGSPSLGNPLVSPPQYPQTSLQLAPAREPLQPQVAGLFFVPSRPTSVVEDKAVAEHYAPLNQQLSQIEDTLDQLLIDVMRVF